MPDYGEEPPPIDYSPIEPTPPPDFAPPPAITPPIPDPNNPVDNPYTPPGGGTENGPGTETGPGGSAAGSVEDYTRLFDAGDKTFIGYLTSLAKMLGFAGNLKDLIPMLPFLLSTLGTANSIDSKKEAAAKIEAAANKSNDFATAEIGNAKGGFTKYNNAGNEAVDQIMWHVNNDKPLTDKYGPVVAPATKKISGAMSLNDLAKVNK